eukprot:scaffold18_cov401-Prasinococcus_capsulatus_cf.AAC.3
MYVYGCKDCKALLPGSSSLVLLGKLRSCLHFAGACGQGLCPSGGRRKFAQGRWRRHADGGACLLPALAPCVPAEGALLPPAADAAPAARGHGGHWPRLSRPPGGAAAARGGRCGQGSEGAVKGEEDRFAGRRKEPMGEGENSF